MNLIFINHLLDVESDTVHDSGGDERFLIEYQTIVSLPNISHRDNDYEMRRSLRPLTISNVVKVEREEGLTNVFNFNRWPEKFSDNILPNQSFRGTVE